MTTTRTIPSEDIGLCDDCGTDEGKRHRRTRTVTIEGETCSLAVWLCDNCR